MEIMKLAEILECQGIRPKEEWDQFFLQNGDIIDREIELAELKNSDVVLEIGAGPGNLTERIAAKSRVIAIEKDRQFMPLLKKIENAEVICGNALDLIRKLEFNKVVSNIPYHISKRLILELLRKKWEVAVLIVQWEFAEKLLRGSRLSLIIEECAGLDTAGRVPAGDFYPPAVESAIIVLRQKKLMDEKFWLFINELFRHRNKNLSNLVENCPGELAKKKVHQVGLEEVKKLYEMNKN